MSDMRGRGEERLPWLQEAATQDDDDRGGFRTMLVTLGALFAGAVLVVAILWFFLFREGAIFGSGQTIEAPAQPYRQKPAEPGGMKVEGTGDVSYGASEGQEIDSTIDLNALPETPVTAPGNATAPGAATASADAITIPGPAARPRVVAATPPPAPANPAAATLRELAARPVAAPAAPAAAPAPAALSGGGTVQLGAFSTQAKAQAAWKSLSGRFPFLTPLGSSVLEVKTGTQTLYRLRAAAGGEAQSICQRLKVAGETCSVVG
ncbi:SPOR domain-containing protein [Sphingomonas naphthae]|uniref:SPOR domain-containing protein n=1 Tax=Sphingomonas naphthae TaxID=1813468 RepID=A0ABY7TKE5_9SPHN|nr:SPOR domain-containing protein [Sphingomonas naphthae]WCT73418.1 SPOR domain-containing protein [Sphingomonas naphthae]